MQRQVIAVFRDDDVRQQRRAGATASIGSDGIGGSTMVWQFRQLIFGRAWTMTLKCEGTYSSTSRSSVPISVRLVPPQAGQTQFGSCSTRSRGRWSGSGRRTGCDRSRFAAAEAAGFAAYGEH